VGFVRIPVTPSWSGAVTEYTSVEVEEPADWEGSDVHVCGVRLFNAGRTVYATAAEAEGRAEGRLANIDEVAPALAGA
jgi:hypothetical protein